jgi:hypothetical protein
VVEVRRYLRPEYVLRAANRVEPQLLQALEVLADGVFVYIELGRDAPVRPTPHVQRFDQLQTRTNEGIATPRYPKLAFLRDRLCGIVHDNLVEE